MIRYHQTALLDDLAVYLDPARAWLLSSALDYHHEIHRLDYRFCDEEEMLQHNQQFLNHHDLTDILTFPDSCPAGHIAGDILINVDRLRDNATCYEVSPVKELHRLLIHGVLHLCGLGDKTEAEAATMRVAEDRCLAKLTPKPIEW